MPTFADVTRPDATDIKTWREHHIGRNTNCITESILYSTSAEPDGGAISARFWRTLADLTRADLPLASECRTDFCGRVTSWTVLGCMAEGASGCGLRRCLSNRGTGMAEVRAPGFQQCCCLRRALTDSGLARGLCRSLQLALPPCGWTPDLATLTRPELYY